MPRSSETLESKVLGFFKTAPLPVAQLLLGLVTTEVKSRSGGIGTPKPAKKKKVDLPTEVLGAVG